MDHSIRGYLERRSTEELDVILNFVAANYEYASDETVRTIIAILREREKGMDLENTPEYQALQQRCLEKAKQLLMR